MSGWLEAIDSHGPWLLLRACHFLSKTYLTFTVGEEEPSRQVDPSRLHEFAFSISLHGPTPTVSLLPWLPRCTKAVWKSLYFFESNLEWSLWMPGSGRLPDAVLVCFDTVPPTTILSGSRDVTGPGPVTEVNITCRLSCGNCSVSAALALALARANDRACRRNAVQEHDIAALKRKLDEQERDAAKKQQALHRELTAASRRKDDEVGRLSDVVLDLSAKLAATVEGAAALTAKKAQLLRHLNTLVKEVTAMKDCLDDEGHISASVSPPGPTQRLDPAPAKLQWTDSGLQEYSTAAKPSPEETVLVEAVYKKVEAAFTPPSRPETGTATPPAAGAHSPGEARAGSGTVPSVPVDVPYYPRIVRGGSAAKGTAVKGKSDVDIVAIVPDFNPAAMATCKCITSTSGRPSRTCHQRWTRLETRGTIGSSALLGRRDAKPAKEANFAIVSSLTPPAAWGLWTVAPPIPGTGTPSS